ncbi:Ig-like domain-containing protein, partial [Achromobacter sp. NPDC058515]|uniref:Ig-like domain-containing protein n=1 Tax=Achromobacter sp. NPDC058515 TaxID=3346533 RepID=UPI0036553409
MTSKPVKILVVQDNKILQEADLRQTERGAPLRIKAAPNGKFVLADKETGFAPENVTVKRVGDDLHISLEGTELEEPQVIVEGFFSQQGELVGMAENGSYYDYVSSDADEDDAVAVLQDGQSSALALGGAELIGFGDGLTPAFFFAPWLAGAALAAGAAGAAAAALGNGGGEEGAPVIATPVLEQAIDDFGPTQGPIAPGGVTDDATPTFMGKGQAPGNTIIILDKGVEIGQVVVDPDGSWSFTPQPPLTDGSHNITMVERTPGGNTSPPSGGFEFEVDTVPPARPLIGGMTDDVGAFQGPIENGGITDDQRPTITGPGEPGATVAILDNGRTIGETVVDENGNWIFTPDTDLGNGSHVITVVLTDPAGNASTPSEPWVVEVDSRIPETPDLGKDGVLENIIDDVGDIQGSIPRGGVTDDTTPTLSGNGRAGDTIIIRDKGNAIAEVVVNENGKWVYTPAAMLEGDHGFSVIVKTPAGQSSKPSEEWAFTIDTLAPNRPSIDGVYDNEGDIKGEVQPGAAIDDPRPVVRGRAEAGSTVKLYDNGNLVGQTVADNQGNWEVRSDALLPGSHSLMARSTDPAGNVSTPSDAFDFTLIIGDAPAVPAITGVTDDVGDYQGPLQKNDRTDDARPVVRGTAEVGTTITLYSNGEEVGSAETDANGQWVITLAADLDEGLNELTAMATNGAGNSSPETGPYAIVLDITRPGNASDQALADDFGPVKGPINNGDTTDDSRPTFSGKAEA